MPQDRPLQLLQRGTGLDAELVDECGSGLAVGLERLRLPARPVERAHHQLTGAFAERMGVNEPFGLRKRVAMAAAGKIGLERALQHEQAHLLEPRRFVLEERLVRQVGEGRSTPQRERLAQQAGGLLETPVVQCDAARTCQPLEHVQVERVRLDTGHVAGASGLDRILIDRLAKLRDRPLDEIRSAGRRLLAPDGIDDARRRYQAAGLGKQHHEHATLTRPAQFDDALVDKRYNRSEQPIPNSRHDAIVPARRSKCPKTTSREPLYTLSIAPSRASRSRFRSSPPP